MTRRCNDFDDWFEGGPIPPVPPVLPMPPFRDMFRMAGGGWGKGGWGGPFGPGGPFGVRPEVALRVVADEEVVPALGQQGQRLEVAEGPIPDPQPGRRVGAARPRENENPAHVDKAQCRHAGHDVRHEQRQTLGVIDHAGRKAHTCGGPASSPVCNFNCVVRAVSIIERALKLSQAEGAPNARGTTSAS